MVALVHCRCRGRRRRCWNRPRSVAGQQAFVFRARRDVLIALRSAAATFYLSLSSCLLVACSSSDPCGGKTGTCLALTITSTDVRTIDALDITASGAVTGTKMSVLQTEHVLPVSLAITFADGNVSGPLHLEVIARLVGGVVGAGSADTAIVAAHHQSISVPIAASIAPGGNDLGDASMTDMIASDAGLGNGAPRLIGPLSGSMVTSPRPLVRWELASGTVSPQLQFSVNRQFTSLIGSASVDSSGASGHPDADLPVGVVFWRVVSMTASGPASSVIWSLNVRKRATGSQPVASSWGHVLDVNGDGYGDLAATAPGVMIGGSLSGRIYLYSGSAAGIPPTATPTTIDGLDGALTNLSLVASAGDVNGDGYGDLLYRGGSGHAYVFQGGANGIPTMAAPATMLKSVEVIAGAGDLDGDGYGDVAVAFQGTVSVYYGSSTGLAASPRTTLDGSDANGGTAPAGFGGSIASAGDVNGDGVADLIVGATDQAFIYLGGKTKLSPLAPLKPMAANDLLDTRALACIGDINGDGYPDVMISGTSTTNKTNAAFVFLGGGAQMTQGQVLVGPAGTGFANAIAPTGDTDGGGLDGVVVGAPFTLGMTSGVPGAIYQYRSGGTMLTGSASFGPTVDGSNYGSACAGAGDINGDGYADFVAAAPQNNTVWITTGGPVENVTTLTGPVANSLFGYSVAQ